MVPPKFMWSVVDRNVVIRRIPVLIIETLQVFLSVVFWVPMRIIQ